MVCANSEGDTPCTKAGSHACQGCFLVAYCCKKCQSAHWEVHRRDCKSPLTRGTWEPSWVTENRLPAYMSDVHGDASFGTRKYFWGDIPAIDVIQLGKNEGNGFKDPLDVLFAASGDMRNAILSVVDLPKGYRGPLNILLNDKDIDIVARNAIFLLVFFVEENPGVAAQFVLHIWYSAMITDSCRNMLQDKIRPMVKDVCDKIMHQSKSTLFSKTWTFGTSSLQLVLTLENWLSLLSYFNAPKGLSQDAARRVRQETMSAPQRVDSIERMMCLMPPLARVGMAKFREDGILVPFGQSRRDFTIPNPTLFRSASEWPMMDNADPMTGWPTKMFQKLDIGPAKNDAYGKLHYYLIRLFADFHSRLHSLPTNFELRHLDAQLLPNHVSKHFDRIDVGHTTDDSCLGADKVLHKFAPLLRPLGVNQHATLITLFINAVPTMVVIRDEFLARFSHTDEIILSEIELRRISLYMPEIAMERERPFNANFTKVVQARRLILDMDEYFDGYMEVHDFVELSKACGLRLKPKHSIIEPWPLKFPGGRPTKKAQGDFKALLASLHTGEERYVEWKLATDNEAHEVE
ncbi:hypothetical protein M426DRAFT_60852 [Hypoxylon sp. CI-4A]|nr:hypothetical protein M426DRAFT_60852 [Hypoxylon sp. CI-4A]